MRVIIGGAGRVGQGIARQLVDENVDVTIVDRDHALVEDVMNRHDVKGIVGHCAYPDTLKQAGARDADMIIAVSYSDETNMMACQIAYSLFAVERTIARVRAQNYLLPEYGDLFLSKNIPVKSIISPEVEVGRSILNRIGTPGTTASTMFVDRQVQVVEIKLGDECPILNTPLRQLQELFPKLSVTVVGVKREASYFVPKGDDQLYAQDEVSIVVPSTGLADIFDLLNMKNADVSQVLIIGGGSIGAHVAKTLELTPKVRCRVIENDRGQAEAIADTLSSSIVIHGDGLDRQILQEAGAESSQLVIALTNDDRVNVLSSAMARELGAQRSIALVNDRNLALLQDNLKVDVFVDPRLSTLSTILRELRRGKITKVTMVGGGEGEVWEIEILNTSPLNRVHIDDSMIPDDVRIGAIWRNGQYINPTPGTEIVEGDRIIIFMLKHMVTKVEKLVRVRAEFF